MAKDAELERLKTIQDQAYQRKQAAHQEQQAAWDKRLAAGQAQARAYDAQQDCYNRQQQSWDALSRMRDRDNPRMDELTRLQQNAFDNMRRAFDNASSAHDRRDGAAARSYADEGQAYKAESQGYVQQRRAISSDLHDAFERHKSLKPAFDQARAAFAAAKATFADAKAEHERKQAAFKSAKAAFDTAARDFRNRLDFVKGENQKKATTKRQQAEKAGVPFQYLDEVWVSSDNQGNTNFYFGGVGKPNGPGHGHYVTDRTGKVTYKREPFDPHGAHNFERDAGLENKLAGVALNLYQMNRSSVGPRQVQFHDGNVTVKVRSGFNRKTNSIATDVIVIDRVNSPDEHLHLILAEHDGSVLFSEWRKNH
ncbi:MAG: hypothetical protein WAQ27_06490 [Candidatus Microsaccharimonas sp.]